MQDVSSNEEWQKKGVLRQFWLNLEFEFWLFKNIKFKKETIGKDIYIYIYASLLINLNLLIQLCEYFSIVFSYILNESDLWFSKICPLKLLSCLCSGQLSRNTFR